MNLASRLLDGGRANPDRVALRSPVYAITYGELARSAARVRSGLSREGATTGEVVAIFASGTDFALAYLGILGIGCIAQPLDPSSPGPELAGALAISGADLVVVGEGLEFPPPAVDRLRVVEIGALIASDRDPPVEIREVDDDTPAALMMTSGTTGPPRAAILTHGSLTANLEQMSSHEGMRAYPSDVWLGILPLFHIFGLNVTLSYALYSGSTLVFPEEETPEGWLDAVGTHGVTVVLGPPQLYSAWLELDAGPEEVRSVRASISGAAPLPVEIFDAFPRQYGLPVWEGYGLTEASPVVSSTLMEAEPVRGSVGRPLPGVRVELRDQNGKMVVVGDTGEVWVRGRNVFAGYWRDEAATADAKVGGWLRTGDVASADGDGRLYLLDRMSDVIIVSGFNVYPAEVERALVEHPSVREAAVVGRPSPRTGEEVVAYVVPEQGGVDGDEVRADCARRIARYKVPVEIRSVDRLDRTPTGKVRRRSSSNSLM